MTVPRSGRPRPLRRHGSRLLWSAVAAGTVVGSYRVVLGTRSQLFGAFPHQGDATSGRVIALTFDDGPNEPHTGQVLDALADRGVPATFFVVGRCAERHPETVRRILAEGHVLGNHSYRHVVTDGLAPRRQLSDLRRAQDVLREMVGVTPALYRPPWMCRLPGALVAISAEGLQPVSGTFLHRFEVLQPVPQRLTAGGLRRAAPGVILIGHDGRESRGGFRGHTAAAVGPLVDELRQRGYSFATVDRVLGVSAYQ